MANAKSPTPLQNQPTPVASRAGLLIACPEEGWPAKPGAFLILQGGGGGGGLVMFTMVFGIFAWSFVGEAKQLTRRAGASRIVIALFPVDFELSLMVGMRTGNCR